MRLALSLPVLVASAAIVILVAGCGPQAEPKPAMNAAEQSTTIPTTVPQVPTAVPAATPASATPPPPAPRPAPQPEPIVRSDESIPMRLEIPSVGVNARVGPLGLTKDGALDAPKNPDDLGWYQLGPTPGERGNALVDGHVDWAGKVRAFWYLKNLRPGDSIIVTDANGARREFAVQWSKWYDADDPAQDLFAQSDQPELTLITCGGQFDRSTHRYLSRLAVRAKLV